MNRLFYDLDLYRAVLDLVDLLAVTTVIYWLLRLIQGTRAVYMLVGLVVAIAILWLSVFADLFTLNWLLSHFFGSLLLIIVVVFQSDIRRALTRVGQAPIFSMLKSGKDVRIIEELVKASVSLANKKIGALIIVEREANVMEYVDLGVVIDAQVSRELLHSIFLPSSPIHDGAVVIQKDRIAAAGCFLPIMMNRQFEQEMGTRHRAAVTLTVETDALVIVVSEEKGWISLAVNGDMTFGVDSVSLKNLLIQYLSGDGPKKMSVPGGRLDSNDEVVA